MGWVDGDGDGVREKGGRKLSFTVLISKEDAVEERIARIVRTELFEVGVEVEVRVEEVKSRIRRLMEGDFEAAIISFNAHTDPSRGEIFWHPSGRFNFGSYRNEEVGELFDRGKATTDPHTRQEIYRRIHALIAEDRPAVFPFFRSGFIAVSSRFANVPPYSPAFYYSMKDWYIRK